MLQKYLLKIKHLQYSFAKQFTATETKVDSWHIPIHIGLFIHLVHVNYRKEKLLIIAEKIGYLDKLFSSFMKACIPCSCHAGIMLTSQSNSGVDLQGCVCLLEGTYLVTVCCEIIHTGGLSESSNIYSGIRMLD
jgi:hypothetical protein